MTTSGLYNQNYIGIHPHVFIKLKIVFNELVANNTGLILLKEKFKTKLPIKGMCYAVIRIIYFLVSGKILKNHSYP